MPGRRRTIASREDLIWFALGDAARRMLLDVLKERGPMPVAEAELVVPWLARTTTRQHLAVLREAGLIAADQAGSRVTLRANPAPIFEVCAPWLRAAALMQKRSETTERKPQHADATQPAA